MPIGRGGAGNIEAQQREASQGVQDVEAQRQAIDQDIAQVLSGETSTTQTYAYSGRGGAGNWYSPQTLGTTGTFTSTSVTEFDQISTPLQQIQGAGNGRSNVISVQQSSSTPPVQRVGRGGAGNFDYSAKSKELEEREREQVKREEIQSAVEQSIDDQLSMPPKARIPTAGVYRG